MLKSRLPRFPGGRVCPTNLFNPPPAASERKATDLPVHGREQPDCARGSVGTGLSILASGDRIEVAYDDAFAMMAERGVKAVELS